MDLAEYLRRRGVTLTEIAEQSRRELHLVPGDVLFLCGSLVEGLGNETSDLDLYLVTSRNDLALTSLHDVMVVVRQCVLDVRVVQRGDVDAVLARFNTWAAQPRDYRSTAALGENERVLLHRLRSGHPVYGDDDFRSLQEQVKPRDLARFRFAVARFAGSTIQVDLAGLRAEDDRVSMPFAAQELLGHAADALLAVHGFTNMNRKWRARGLAAVPSDWERDLPGRRTGKSAIDVYRSLHRTPEQDDPAAVLGHAQRIAAFSRRAFGWAEHRLFGTGSPLRGVASSEDGRGSAKLPHLDLDVSVSWGEEAFDLRRLNAPGPAFALSPEEYSLLCLFDGETSVEAAIALANAMWKTERGSDVVEQMTALIRHGDLGARPMVDKQTLKRILRPPASTHSS